MIIIKLRWINMKKRKPISFKMSVNSVGPAIVKLIPIAFLPKWRCTPNNRAISIWYQKKLASNADNKSSRYEILCSRTDSATGRIALCLLKAYNP